ncbi:hypothetical protein QA644_10660 [Rhizobium sp. CC1099]|uniref:hypothetical protein n=1 Tax=Rhizobium sp. CC1099 TaxID=3039160 RepID=UPI0024B11DEA|nr:hypothetical protein [Rhizobium sp. CC1099]WFU89457.1 hypothetical protein QA644_10660 [Rhizobium sp. CC1099]
MTILLAIVRYLGVAGCAVVALLVYYEGVPVVSKIPYINVIPLIGNLAVGEKQRYAAEQVRLATSQMVTKFERDAIAAQLAEERRRRLIADQLTTEASKRAEAALRAKSEAEAGLEARIAADTSPDGGRWSEEDQQWDGRR